MKKYSRYLLILSVMVNLIYLSTAQNSDEDKLSGLLLMKQNFDTIVKGKEVTLFTLRNDGGIVIQLTNYGGHLVSVLTPDKNGNYADVILGYDRIADYLEHKLYQACIIGPFAYIIANGKFSIDGVNYQLELNNGRNNLHSFPDGFDKEVFDAVQEGNRVTLSAKVPHMKNGFPGNRDVTIIYELLGDNRLRLECRMTTDRKTICNITNHAYFNLAGQTSDDIQDHIIQIFADSYTPYKAGSTPSGEIASVENTPFDLRNPVPIRKMIDSDHEQIRQGRGYDRNFVLSKETGKYGIDARLTDPESGRFMEVYSNQPGIQFYSGSYLKGTVKGKSGKPITYRSALCLEPMKFPDSPNQPNFPSTILEPGEVYYNVMDYVFGVEIPPLVVPQYSSLKDMSTDIVLVSEKESKCAIATPGDYMDAAKVLQSFMEQLTGAKIPVIADTDPQAAAPLATNLIVLGNRSTSAISCELYDRFYSLMDLKYPGPKGYAVRSLHDPYGNGHNAILIGGSDKEGVVAGINAFIAYLKELPASSGRNLSVGWTMLTKLGEGVKIPVDIREFETWEASKGYGSVGYFGWNSISKRMAMYYMTGDPFHAREVIRLSFPDEQAFKEIDEIDGERIENKKDPLAGPYHYNATMTILFWDLIEESPVFADTERLDVTNAFARRLDHEGTTPFDKNTYRLNSVPAGVGSRHGQWSGLSLYTLGRYFNKYYPSPVWAQAKRAGKLSFASLHETAYVSGESDALGWYCTGIAPILTYMVLTGDRKPLENGVLQEMLRGQEVLLSGLSPDGNLNSAALDFLNKAAYLTGDGRWITYRERTGMDTDIFRLGQSFWPEVHIKPALPVDLTDRWTINPIPEQMWKRRNTNFTLEQSFQNMSYRSSPDAGGDYIFLKGFNGAYRNPYHTFALLELRLNGETLLKGFNNQVLTSADGMVEPTVAMDAALLYHDVVGEVAVALANVPNLPFTNWKRAVIQRKGKYTLIFDDLTFRSADPDNKEAEMVIRVETNWETPGKSWLKKSNYIEIQPDGNFSQNKYELHPSDLMDLAGTSNISLIWSRPVKNGQNSKFFYLLGQNKTGGTDQLSCIKLSDNAAALSLPEAAVAVAGEYGGNQAELLILSGNNIYGHLVSRAGLGQSILEADNPVDIDWDFNSGDMALINAKKVKLSLSVTTSRLSLNGKTIKGRKTGGQYVFEIPAGRNTIRKAKLSTGLKESLRVQLYALSGQAETIRAEQLVRDMPAARISPSVLNPVIRRDLGGSPIESIIIPSGQGDLLCTATGKSIVLMDSEGREVRRMSTSDDVRVLHWWADHKLLLAGCVDEQVVAFDEKGQKRWEFTSVMDPAVYEAGKPYWFKSAYPGIYGLYSGVFDGGKSRAFVGSACTLEILDENGQLVKRTPVFWGPGQQFLMIDGADGSKSLLVGRWNNDWPTFVVIGSKTLAETGRGYNGVPPGHTFVNGWSAMNRFDNFLTDLNNDGNKEVVSAINGTWNRITIYTEDGQPLYNVQVGPGVRGERTNIRMMDVGDLNGDGNQEIVAGLSSGFLNLLDNQVQKRWAKILDSPPTVVKMVKEQDLTWICAGCEDGTILALDKDGNIFRQGKVTGRPTDIKVIQTPRGPMVMILTNEGEVVGFNRGIKELRNR